MVENLDHVGLNVNRTRKDVLDVVLNSSQFPWRWDLYTHVYTHTHTHTVGGRGWVYLFYIVRFRLSIR